MSNARNLYQTTISNSPGTTGDFTISSASSGYLTFGAADDTLEFDVKIEETGVGKEVRTGCVYTHSTTNLTRGTLETSTSGSALNFTSAAIVTVVAVASWGNRAVLDSPGIWSLNNKVYGDVGLAAAGATLTLTADRAYALQFERAVYAPIDALIFRVTTAGAASTQAVIAIFSHGSDGLPGTQLAVSSPVAVDSTGNKVATFTQFIPPERFFGCLLSNGTPVVSGSATGMINKHTMGAEAGLSLRSYIHHVGATGLTFPSPWTPVGNASNAARPLLLARCV